MLRAQLIMNPEARGVTPAMQRVVEAALKARFKLDAVRTQGRDAGIGAAREAVDAGAELVVAFGGDGLVNEVVNGIAGTDTALAIVPGGTMNVLARNLGIPTDPLEATDLILRRTGRIEPRVVRLGKAGDRYFTFVCGCGFDAETAAWVEAHKPSKRKFGEPYFFVAGFMTFLREYATRQPFLRVEGEFGSQEGVLAMGLNSATYAYLLGRSIKLGSTAAGAAKIDLFFIQRMQAWRLPAYAAGAFLTGRFGTGSLRISGLEEFRVSSLNGEPFPLHVDGEPLDPALDLTIEASRVEIRVVV